MRNSRAAARHRPSRKARAANQADQPDRCSPDRDSPGKVSLAPWVGRDRWEAAPWALLLPEEAGDQAVQDRALVWVRAQVWALAPEEVWGLEGQDPAEPAPEGAAGAADSSTELSLRGRQGNETLPCLHGLEPILRWRGAKILCEFPSSGHSGEQRRRSAFAESPHKTSPVQLEWAYRANIFSCFDLTQAALRHPSEGDH